jgi:hypothetical protein
VNERIKLLAIQAKYDARSNRHYLERVHNREITLEEYQEMYDQKFAELIVRECADKVFDIFDALPDVSVSDLQYYIRDRIKEHFGVEE